MNFYNNILNKLLKNYSIDINWKVLVICGGKKDRDELLSFGFKDVTISNIDENLSVDQYKPFSRSFQNAEKLSFEDESYDLVIVHDGLHHCQCPHAALFEMYRVARKAVIVIESQDSPLLWLAKKIGFSSDYEIEAVFSNGFECGGVANSEIPNYIYRWTRREVTKFIASTDPTIKPNISFYYNLRLPLERLKLNRNKYLYYITYLIQFAIKLFVKLFPRLANSFAFFVDKQEKNKRLFSWLKIEGQKVVINKDWCQERFIL